MKAKILSLFCLSLLISSVHGKDSNISNRIALMSDAKVFSQLGDDMPFVVNYFSQATEDSIITFYQKAYNDPVKTQRKRARLVLWFHTTSGQQQLAIRVIISQQNAKRQVDVMQQLRK